MDNDFQWFLMDFQRFSMISNGLLIVFNGWQYIFNIFNDSQWFLMCFQWVLMDFHDNSWNFMKFHEIAWKLMKLRWTACAVTILALSKWHAELCYSTISQTGSVSVDFLAISRNFMKFNEVPWNFMKFHGV